MWSILHGFALAFQPGARLLTRPTLMPHEGAGYDAHAGQHATPASGHAQAEPVRAPA